MASVQTINRIGAPGGPRTVAAALTPAPLRNALYADPNAPTGLESTLAALAAALRVPTGAVQALARTDQRRQAQRPPAQRSESSLGESTSLATVRTLSQAERANQTRHVELIKTLKQGFGIGEYQDLRNKATGGAGGMLGGFDLLKQAQSSIKGLVGSLGGLLKSPGFARLARVGSGPLAGIVGGISKYMDVKDRDDLSTGQKAAQVGFTGLGAAGGAVAGAAIGSVVPVVGTIIGAAVGGWLGSKGGEKVGEIISDNFTEIKDGFKKTATFMSESFYSTIQTTFGDKAAKDVKDALASVKKMANKGYQRAVDATSEGMTYAADAGSNALEAVKLGAAKTATAAYDVARRGAGTVAKRFANVKDDLVGASNAAGVDAGTVTKIARFESGFDTSASPGKLSSAHGLGQFIDDTWLKTLRKHGAKYGVADAKNLTKSQAELLRTDKKLQAAMLAEFTKENVDRGRKIGGTNDDANVYALHNLGSGDGSKFLKAMKDDPNAPVSSVLSAKVIANNPALYKGNPTLAEAYNRMGQSMDKGEVYAKEARVAQAMRGDVQVAQAVPPKPPAKPAATVAATTNNGGGGGNPGLKDLPMAPMDPRLSALNSGGA